MKDPLNNHEWLCNLCGDKFSMFAFGMKHLRDYHRTEQITSLKIVTLSPLVQKQPSRPYMNFIPKKPAGKSKFNCSRCLETEAPCKCVRLRLKT